MQTYITYENHNGVVHTVNTGRANLLNLCRMFTTLGYKILKILK